VSSHPDHPVLQHLHAGVQHTMPVIYPKMLHLHLHASVLNLWHVLSDPQEDQCSIAPMLAILYFCIYTLVCTYIMLVIYPKTLHLHLHASVLNLWHVLSNPQEDQCSIAPMLAILYFCIYMLVCTYIMLQLIIGIIVDNIEMAENMETMAITQASSRASCIHTCADLARTVKVRVCTPYIW